MVPPMMLHFLKVPSNVMDETDHDIDIELQNLDYDTSCFKNLRVVSIAGAPLSELVLEFAKRIPQAAIGQIYGRFCLCSTSVS